MAFTGTLNPATPANGDRVSLGAQKIRELTLAVQERLASLTVDVDADPLQLKAGAIPSGYAIPSPTISTPTITGASSFGGAVTISSGGLTVGAGGAAITGNSTVTGTLAISGAITGAAGATITGTVTATTFVGSGASLTNLPAANIVGTLPAISGVNLTDLNASNITSGSLANGRLPSLITGRAQVGANALTGGTSSTAVITLDNSAEDFLTLPAGSTFRVTNNGSPNNYARTGPFGLSGYDGGQSDRFLVVDSEGTTYYIRLERWTA